MRDPVFQRYGGARGISRLAFRFYDKVMASDRLRPYFDDIDMPRLVEHQAAIIVSLLGDGRVTHSDAELATLHAHLDIGPAEFDEMVDLLTAAIAEEGHAEGEADRVFQHSRRMRDRLVGAIGRDEPIGA